MAKFRKKPVVIEAEQFHISGDPELYPEGLRWGGNLPDGTGCYVIDTLEGQMKVSNGDWIITGTKGEKYPCKPDIFEAIYERTE